MEITKKRKLAWEEANLENDLDKLKNAKTDEEKNHLKFECKKTLERIKNL